MLKKVLTAVYLAAIILFAAAGFVQPASACTSANTLNKNQFAIEIDYERIRNRDCSLEVYQHLYLYYGVTDHLMFYVIQPWRQLTTPTGVYTHGKADTAAIFKYRFKDETPTSPALALKPYVDFNNAGDIPAIVGTGDYGLWLIASKYLGKGYFGEINVGYEVDFPSYINQFRYEAALEKTITKNFHLRCEFLGHSYTNNTNVAEAVVFPIFLSTDQKFFFAPKYQFSLNNNSPRNHIIFDTGYAF